MVVNILVWLIGGILWYLYYGLECSLNGGMGCWTLPFKCLWDDIRFKFSKKARIAWAIGVVGTKAATWGGCLMGYKHDYRHIREHDLYDEFAKAVLPGWIHFILTHILIPAAPYLIKAAIYGF